MMRLLARDDPHPARSMCTPPPCACWPWTTRNSSSPLRAFELLLLRETGFLPSLDRQNGTLAPLDARQRYSLRPKAGWWKRTMPTAGQPGGRAMVEIRRRLATRRRSTPLCGPPPPWAN